jgi:ATPase subunit of ABC transporter with duplicated ATPase domains
MAIQVQVSHVGKGFVNPLFEDVNLTAAAPEVIGLIGDNGTGKSTFLRMLAGKEDINEGKIIWSKECKIGYLEQEINSENVEISGGEQKIINLYELFYGDYNVLLLDEADNHLDLEHKLWFEEMVMEFQGLCIVISHDRRFLARATTKIWQVAEKKITAYDGGYEKFKEIYLAEMTDRKHLWEVQEKERLRLKDLVIRMRVQAAANDKFVGRLHNAEKRYERWVRDMTEKPPEDKEIKLEVTLDKQHHKKTAVYVKNLHKDYGQEAVLAGVNLHIFCGEKVAILAPNGAGKSTLLNILSGRLKPSSGEVVIGPNLSIGYYTQDHLQALDEKSTLISELQKSAKFTHYEAVAYLKKFLFDKNQAESEVRFLSGGQKSRLQLAKFLATNPEILVLDEPTNHLDIKTVTALENFLTEYQGTLILVSHDRELVEKTTEIRCELSGGKLTRVNF